MPSLKKNMNCSAYRIHGNNLNNERHRASRVDNSGKDREYLKDSTNKHVSSSKNKNIRDIHAGNRGYHLSANPEKGKKSLSACRFRQQFEYVQNLFLSPF